MTGERERIHGSRSLYSCNIWLRRLTRPMVDNLLLYYRLVWVIFHYTSTNQDTKRNNRFKAQCINQDAGSSFTVSFLNRMEQVWKDKYIRSFTSFSGVFGGSSWGLIPQVGIIAPFDDYLGADIAFDILNLIRSWGEECDYKCLMSHTDKAQWRGWFHMSLCLAIECSSHEHPAITQAPTQTYWSFCKILQQTTQHRCLSTYQQRLSSVILPIECYALLESEWTAYMVTFDQCCAVIHWKLTLVNRIWTKHNGYGIYRVRWL